MRDILEHYKIQILEYVKNRLSNIRDINEIRINMSAVFECIYNEKPCIFKYFIIEDVNNIDFSEYSFIHAKKMLNLSKCSSFPDIYASKILKIEDYSFLLIVEERLPYNFSEGINKIYLDTNKDVIQCASLFLLSLLSLYIEGRDFGFVSHRDLSFDNIMFDEEYNIKMIDLGSAKSTEAETTMFHIPAPTKNFYSAPEYEELHKGNKTETELIKAEIYTIGLLTLSLLNSLKNDLFQKNDPVTCGIVYWIKVYRKGQNLGEKFEESFKREYINYTLINIFSGDDKNNLYKILKGMTDNSVSSRIANYDLIIKVLEREVS